MILKILDHIRYWPRDFVDILNGREPERRPTCDGWTEPDPVPRPAIPASNTQQARITAQATSTPALPNVMYHGTPSTKNAADIMRTGWRIGPSQPHGIWLSPNFEVAKTYAKERGAVVAVHINHSLIAAKPDEVVLEHKGEEKYVLKIWGAQNGDHLIVYGIQPYAVFDKVGRRMM